MEDLIFESPDRCKVLDRLRRGNHLLKGNLSEMDLISG